MACDIISPRHQTRRVATPTLMLAVALALPGAGFAQSVSIGPDASWQAGDAAISFGCAEVSNTGHFDAGSAELSEIGDFSNSGQTTASAARFEVGGDWDNSGGFDGGDSVVAFADACGRAAAQLTGSTTFPELRIESARAKQYRFEAGATQQVVQALHLQGAPGQHLLIRSTAAGSRADIALATAGTQSVGWIDAADMGAPFTAAWIAPGPAEAYDSLDSGGNFRWFGSSGLDAPRVVPAASAGMLALLALALGLIGWRGLRGMAGLR